MFLNRTHDDLVLAAARAALNLLQILYFLLSVLVRSLVCYPWTIGLTGILLDFRWRAS